MSSDARRARLAWAALVALVGLPARGDAARSAAVELDPQQTVVRFALPGTLHDTHGTFRLERGAIDVDATTGVAHGLVVVDAESGASGNAARDRRMRDLVLETGAHPEIEFRPERIDGALGPRGAFDGTVHGILTLRGVAHDVDVTAHGRLTGSDVAATCRFAVPYVAWGLPDPSLLFLRVAKEVSIEVSTVGHLRWKDGAGP